MKKNKVLIILIITFISFCFGINEVKAETLPPCDLEFYGLRDPSIGVTDDVFLGKSKEITRLVTGSDSKLPGWSTGEIDYMVAYNINKKNRLHSFVFSIEREEKGKVCESEIIAGANIKKGDTAYLSLIFEKNESLNGDNSCKGGVWKYGGVYKINVSGKYENYSSKDGELVELDSTESFKTKRCGRQDAKEDDEYGRPPTQKPATKADGSLEPTSAVEITKVQGSSAGVAKGSNKKIYFTKTDKDGNIIFEKNKGSCTDVKNIIDEYWKYVMVIVPILLIIVLIIDFFKAMTSNDADAIKKAGTNTIKRTIATVILLALPVLISIIFGFFDLEVCI